MDENTESTRTGDESTEDRPGDESAGERPGGESAGERPGGVDRRDYLRTIGGAGTLGLLGAGASGAVLAQSSDWEAAADDRIQQHRTGGLEVVVQDANGQPVSGADVSVEMQEHDYWFGYVLSANLLINETEPGHPYRQTLKEDFNVVWFGNYHKWRFFEENQDVSDQATAWAKDNGLDVRGHVCLWANVGAYAVPADVVDAMGLDHQNGQDGPDLDSQYVRDRTFDHVQTIIDHYADFEYDGTSYGSAVEEWEVMNEVPHQPGLIRAVNGVPADQEAPDIDPVTAPVLAEWYNHARDVAPDDVGLATNDYNVMPSPQYAGDDYERQVQFLAENGSLDYVGIQSHFGSESTAVTPQETLDVLDRYAQHGVRLRVTEYDATGDDWSDEAKAEFFHDYLKTVFSHEATDAFLVAGGSDEHHWRDDAPFYYAGWDPKPAYDVYQNLVFDEWWTSESGTTDGSGVYGTNAFLGTHEVTVSTGGTTVTREVAVTDPTAGATIQVQVPADSDSECTPWDYPGAPAWSDGTQPRDVDGDGLYEDFNGNCRTDNDDVVTFFENMDRSAVAENPSYYDFNGNGRIDFDDIVTLFEGL